MSTNHHSIFRFIFIFILCLPVFCLPAEAGHTLDELKTDTSQLAPFTSRECLIGAILVRQLVTNHYTHPQTNQELSKQWFENYFDILDSEHSYFTQEDIDEFRSFSSDLLKLHIQQLDLTFARNVYERLMERIRLRALFLEEFFKNPQDFSKEEYIPVNQKKLPWCKNLDELKESWRLIAKNAVLSDKLADEQQEKEILEEKGDAPSATPSPVFKKKTIQERMIQRQVTHYYTRLEFDPLELLEPYFNALTGLLDPHSSYMAPMTQENFDIAMSLSLQGIGATLIFQDSYTTIFSIVKGSPAEKCGELSEGDKIVAVAQDGEEPVNVIDMPLNRVVQQIRGPKGTKVHLTIIHKNSNKEVNITIVRDEIKMEDAGAQSKVDEITLANGQKASVLTIYLPGFYRDFKGMIQGRADFRSTTRDIEALIKQQTANQKIDGVILDLRGNGGGSLEEAIDLPGLFFDYRIPVVQVRNSLDNITRYATRPKGLLPTQPIIVLTDSSSASASEIVAACLQDTNRALILGDKSTHGKGSVQNIMEIEKSSIFKFGKDLSDDRPNGSLRVTISKFYRIQGGSTQIKGVIPDITFPSFYDDLESTENFLPHALSWDEIAPLKFKKFKNSWKSHLNELKKVAENYMKESPDFSNHLKFIKEFAEYRKNTRLPLELNARRAYQEKEEKLLDQLIANMPENFWKKQKTTTQQAPMPDVIQGAALKVMEKMIEYDQQQ